jgi:hypothetical protein
MSFDGDGIIFDASTGVATFNRLATFNAQTDFNGVTSFTDTVSFSGGSATFATPTTFTFGSTFQAATTFNGTTNFILSRVERGRPWLRIKLAASLDGRTAMANGESKWITGEAARADVQRWRARSAAILTGADTVLADDPALTVTAV